METFLEFERPIATLEKKLQDIKDLSAQDDVNLSDEIVLLEKKLTILIEQTFSKLTPWQRVQLSRHPNRPYTRDYLESLFPSFMELNGDRNFSNDRAIIAGIAEWPPKMGFPELDNGGLDQLPKKGRKREAIKKFIRPGTSKTLDTSLLTKTSIMIIGHQKGRTTKQKMMRSFGMARPEGYRKSMRLMALAERSRIPILTMIDTPGAYPGIDAEARGQAQAIAESIRFMFGLTVPVVALVLGEGGSGGALALGVGNRVLMQEFSTYSVISPESCASILWSDATLAEKASSKLKMNPADLLKLGVIDEIIPEPKGGAHRNWKEAFELVGKALMDNLNPMLTEFRSSKKEKEGKIEDVFKVRRQKKFRAMGKEGLGRTTETNPVTKSSKKVVKKSKIGKRT